MKTHNSGTLDALFRPAAVALVGARDGDSWTNMALDSLRRSGYAGPIHLVGRRAGSVGGLPVVDSWEGIAGVDFAILLVSRSATIGALEDAAAAGVTVAVVLASGFAENGDEGREAQRDLQVRADELGIRLLGPNSIGLVNYLDDFAAWMSPVPRSVVRGSGVAVVSQSGNIGQVIGDAACAQGVGVTHIISTGNETDLSAASVIDALLEDDRVRAIGVFVESIRDPQHFLRVSRRAAERQVPIVMFKIGASELGRRVAQTHTGAMTGDDRLVDAALRSAGVIRVHRVEELVATAGLLAETGPLLPGGMGVVSISGGANDIIAERAGELGVDVPELSLQTQNALATDAVPFATIQNPLDLTGAAGRNEQAWVNSVHLMADDPNIAIVVVAFSRLAHPMDETSLGIDTQRLGWVAQGAARARGRVALLLVSHQHVQGDQVVALRDIGAPHLLDGIDLGVAAVHHAIRWSAWLRAAADPPHDPPHDSPAEDDPRLSAAGVAEWEAIQVLQDRGVPFVPWLHAGTLDDARAGAQKIGFPVVVKVSSRDIAHKSDIGGVRLGVASLEEVEREYVAVTSAGEVAASGSVDGVLVMATADAGQDVLVGTVKDDGWGTFLVLGRGGVDAELVDDTAIRLLPVDATEVRSMIASLRTFTTSEHRGRPAPNVDAFVDAVLAFAGAVASLGSSVGSVEVNPLRVTSGGSYGLDALITPSDARVEDRISS